MLSDLPVIDGRVSTSRRLSGAFCRRTWVHWNGPPIGQRSCMRDPGTYSASPITSRVEFHRFIAIEATRWTVTAQSDLLEPAQRHPAQSCIHLLSFLQVLVGSYFGKSIFGKRHQTEMLQRPHA